MYLLTSHTYKYLYIAVTFDWLVLQLKKKWVLVANSEKLLFFLSQTPMNMVSLNIFPNFNFSALSFYNFIG